MGQQSANEVISQLREVEATRVGLVLEQVLFAVANAHVHVQAIARTIAERLGHERADQAHLIGDLGCAHLEEGVVVAGGQRVGVGVVDLELAVGVLVVDLIDVDADCAHRFRQPLKKRARARQALVVVAGLGQRVSGVAREQASLDATQQGELGLHAGEEGPALGRHPRQLLFENDTRAVGPGLAVYVPIGGHARITRLPRHQAQGARIAHGHVVAVGIRPHTHAGERETGKAGTVGDHRVVVLGRDRLGLGCPVHVYELREDVLHPVVLDELLGVCWFHCCPPCCCPACGRAFSWSRA